MRRYFRLMKNTGQKSICSVFFVCPNTVLKKIKVFGLFFIGDPWENRTPVFAVRGRCLSRLTKGPFILTRLLYHKVFLFAIGFLKKIVFFKKYFQKYLLKIIKKFPKLLTFALLCGIINMLHIMNNANCRNMRARFNEITLVKGVTSFQVSR